MSDDASAGTDPRVAEVLGDLQHLEELGVDQHVAVFETAHARLRGLLTEQGDLAPPARGVAGH